MEYKIIEDSYNNRLNGTQEQHQKLVEFDKPLTVNIKSVRDSFETKYFMVSAITHDNSMIDEETYKIPDETYAFACDEDYKWISASQVKPVSQKGIFDCMEVIEQLPQETLYVQHAQTMGELIEDINSPQDNRYIHK